MKTRMRNKKVVGGTVGLAALVAAIVTVIAATGASGSSSAPPASTATVPVAESSPIYIGEPGSGVDHFGSLQPATSAAVEALPETVAHALAGLREHASVNPAQANFATNPVRGTVSALDTTSFGVGSQVGVAEANGELCVFASGPDYQGAAVGDCSSLGQAEAGGAYVTVPGMTEGATRIIGLAPDGVTSIAIDSNEDGSVDQKVPVVDNLYQADVEPVVTTISGLNESGQTIFTNHAALAAGAQ